MPEEDTDVEADVTEFVVAPELDVVDPNPVDFDPECEFAGANVTGVNESDPEVALDPGETKLPVDDELESDEEGLTDGALASELDDDSVLASDSDELGEVVAGDFETVDDPDCESSTFVEGFPDVDSLPVELVASELPPAGMDPVKEFTGGAEVSGVNVKEAPVPLDDADVSPDGPSEPLANEADALEGIVVVGADPAFLFESFTPELPNDEASELDPVSEAEESTLGVVVTGISDAEAADVFEEVEAALDESVDFEPTEAEPEVDLAAGVLVVDPVPDIAPDLVEAELSANELLELAEDSADDPEVDSVVMPVVDADSESPFAVDSADFEEATDADDSELGRVVGIEEAPLPLIDVIT